MALEKLQRHGAKGPPESSPTRGLTDDQFKEVAVCWDVPCENSIELQSSILAIESIGLPVDGDEV